MRLLVCGGRDYLNRTAVFDALDRAHRHRAIALVIHGAAPGADSLGAAWAEDRGIASQAFPADWRALGPRAGPARNQQMIDAGKPDGVVAFPGGTGTADMIRRAIKAGVKIWQPYG